MTHVQLCGASFFGEDLLTQNTILVTLIFEQGPCRMFSIKNYM